MARGKLSNVRTVFSARFIQPAVSKRREFLCEEMSQHPNLSWNPATKEWFCRKCGRTSDHASENDAHVELDQHECEVPSVERTTTAPGTKTMRLLKKSYKTLNPKRQK